MVDYFVVAFQTGHDSATFWDRGTEAPSLSRDKGTVGQKSCQGMGLATTAKIWDGTGRITKNRDKTGQSRKQENDILKQKTMSYNRKGCSKTRK